MHINKKFIFTRKKKNKDKKKMSVVEEMDDTEDPGISLKVP